MAISRLAFIKALEVVLTIVLVTLHYYSFVGTIEIMMIATGAYVGYLIIFTALAAGILMQSPINKRIDIFFSIVGCALFVASGALIIDAYQNASRGDFRDKQLAKASISIVNGAILLIDALLTWRGESY